LSCLGQNVLFCMRRYNCSDRDLSESANNIIKSFVLDFVCLTKICTVLLFFLFGLIMINDDLFLYDELQTMIDFVCTL